MIATGITLMSSYRVTILPSEYEHDQHQIQTRQSVFKWEANGGWGGRGRSCHGHVGAEVVVRGRQRHIEGPGRPNRSSVRGMTTITPLPWRHDSCQSSVNNWKAGPLAPCVCAPRCRPHQSTPLELYTHIVDRIYIGEDGWACGYQQTTCRPHWVN